MYLSKVSRGLMRKCGLSENMGVGNVRCTPWKKVHSKLWSNSAEEKKNCFVTQHLPSLPANIYWALPMPVYIPFRRERHWTVSLVISAIKKKKMGQRTREWDYVCWGCAMLDGEGLWVFQTTHYKKEDHKLV